MLFRSRTHGCVWITEKCSGWASCDWEKKKGAFYFIISGVAPKNPPAAAHHRQAEGRLSSRPGEAPAAASLWVWIRKFISGWIRRCNNSLAEHKEVNVLKGASLLGLSSLPGEDGGWLCSSLLWCRTAPSWWETVMLELAFASLHLLAVAGRGSSCIL